MAGKRRSPEEKLAFYETQQKQYKEKYDALKKQLDEKKAKERVKFEHDFVDYAKNMRVPTSGQSVYDLVHTQMENDGYFQSDSDCQ